MIQFSILDFGFSIGRSEPGKILGVGLCAMLFALCSSVEASSNLEFRRSAGSECALFRTQVAAMRYFGKNSAPSAMLRART